MVNQRGNHVGNRLVARMVIIECEQLMTMLPLTYHELAERTGRTREGARTLARNHRWATIRGNDGKAHSAGVHPP